MDVFTKLFRYLQYVIVLLGERKLAKNCLKDIGIIDYVQIDIFLTFKTLFYCKSNFKTSYS